MTETPKSPSLPEQLSELFGSYKAEWLRERIYELYREPSYFPELTTSRPCILIGGRGTGKTTVLRGLSYPGQFALAGGRASSIAAWRWFGLYYRVNTNHVTAFRGPELNDDQWTPLFAHYFNTVLCELILEFLAWYELHTGSAVELRKQDCQRIAASLHLQAAQDHRELREYLIDSKIGFEAYVNNVVDGQRPPLSLEEAPIDLLCRAIVSLSSFEKKPFFFLIDEYENFLDYQQQVVNTLIKHASDVYSFKIGVRELGWRCHSTLNANEQLVHPADYARINIAEKLSGPAFDRFALDVCSHRLARLHMDGKEIIRDVAVVFPSLSEEDEAARLGVEDQATLIRKNLLRQLGPKECTLAEALKPLEVCFLQFWARAQKSTVEQVFREAMSDPAGWKTRYKNYKYPLLFTLRRRKRGIRKYYAGWGVFTQLAAGNIRYVLELVDQCFHAQFNETQALSEPISAEIQTKVAQRVGSMSLAELEGLSVNGAQLTKLLLALGRVFQVMAADPEGHAPEVNQFEIVADEGPAQDEACAAAVNDLLNSAVMHLALVRFAGNKLGDVGDTKDFDYMIHPIYCPLFVFSYRQKRKMGLRPETVLGLIQRPKQTIRSVLAEHNRSTREDDLPEQLLLFEKFYDGGT